MYISVPVPEPDNVETEAETVPVKYTVPRNPHYLSIVGSKYSMVSSSTNSDTHFIQLTAVGCFVAECVFDYKTVRNRNEH